MAIRYPVIYDRVRKYVQAQGGRDITPQSVAAATNTTPRQAAKLMKMMGLRISQRGTGNVANGCYKPSKWTLYNEEP